MSCSCDPAGGYCDVHKIYLSERQRQQCRDVPGMFEALVKAGRLAFARGYSQAAPPVKPVACDGGCCCRKG